MKLVFTGIQGCGKGTQARILAERHGFEVVEMGTEFRKIMKSDSELGKKIREIVNSGAQVPAELGRQVMEQALKENRERDIIYDGFIRNEWNVEVFNEHIEDYKVVLFKLDLETARDRLLGRMFDPETGETFTSGTEYNPKTGNKLVKRADDKDTAAIEKRFNEFIEKTLPVIEKQKEAGLVIEVEADQAIEAVTKELEEKVGI